LTPGPFFSVLHDDNRNSRELPGNVLFAVTFGAGPAPVAAVAVRVNLEPLVGKGLAEIWYANGPVVAATTGAIRHAADEGCERPCRRVRPCWHCGAMHAG